MAPTVARTTKTSAKAQSAELARQIVEQHSAMTRRAQSARGMLDSDGEDKPRTQGDDTANDERQDDSRPNGDQRAGTRRAPNGGNPGDHGDDDGDDPSEPPSESGDDEEDDERRNQPRGNTTRSSTTAEEVAKKILQALASNLNPSTPPKVVPFTLTPADSFDFTPVDYTSSTGAKIYKQAVEPLKTEYDLSSASLQLFLTQLESRAVTMAWSYIYHIPDKDGKKRSLFQQFGMLTKENVKDHADTYMIFDDKRKQMAWQMAACITSSLAPKAQLEMRVAQDKCTNHGILHGPTMLFVIIHRASINIRASTFLFRQRLVRAPLYLQAKDFDVKVFNEHIADILFNLRARGETAPDTLIHLFNAYKSAPDEDFVNYIKAKETLYEEEEIELDPDTLMELALTKYNTFCEQGTWNQLSKEQEEIIALKAQVNKLENAKNDSSNKKDGAKKADGAKGISKKRDERKARDTDESWKHKKTLDVIVRNETPWHWCPFHNKYTIHKPEVCKLNPKVAKVEKAQGMTTTVEDLGVSFGDDYDE